MKVKIISAKAGDNHLNLKVRGKKKITQTVEVDRTNVQRKECMFFVEETVQGISCGAGVGGNVAVRNGRYDEVAAVGTDWVFGVLSFGELGAFKF